MFGDTRLRSELGGSRLRGKEHHLSRPGMRDLVGFWQTKNDATGSSQTQRKDPGNWGILGLQGRTERALRLQSETNVARRLDCYRL